MGSLTFKLDGGAGVAWGSNKIYAAIHQFGGVIVPVKAKALVFRIGGKVIRCKRVVMPARPYLGMGHEERERALETATFTLEEAVTGYAARQILGSS